jgi:hypothetical protein
LNATSVILGIRFVIVVVAIAIPLFEYLSTPFSEWTLGKRYEGLVFHKASALLASRRFLVIAFTGVADF